MSRRECPSPSRQHLVKKILQYYDHIEKSNSKERTQASKQSQFFKKSNEKNEVEFSFDKLYKSRLTQLKRFMKQELKEAELIGGLDFSPRKYVESKVGYPSFYAKKTASKSEKELYKTALIEVLSEKLRSPQIEEIEDECDSEYLKLTTNKRIVASNPVDKELFDYDQRMAKEIRRLQFDEKRTEGKLSSTKKKTRSKAKTSKHSRTSSKLSNEEEALDFLLPANLSRQEKIDKLIDLRKLVDSALIDYGIDIRSLDELHSELTLKKACDIDPTQMEFIEQGFDIFVKGHDESNIPAKLLGQKQPLADGEPESLEVKEDEFVKIEFPSDQNEHTEIIGKISRPLDESQESEIDFLVITLSGDIYPVMINNPNPSELGDSGDHRRSMVFQSLDKMRIIEEESHDEEDGPSINITRKLFEKNIRSFNEKENDDNDSPHLFKQDQLEDSPKPLRKSEIEADDHLDQNILRNNIEVVDILQNLNNTSTNEILHQTKGVSEKEIEENLSEHIRSLRKGSRSHISQANEDQEKNNKPESKESEKSPLSLDQQEEEIQMTSKYSENREECANILKTDPPASSQGSEQENIQVSVKHEDTSPQKEEEALAQEHANLLEEESKKALQSEARQSENTDNKFFESQANKADSSDDGECSSAKKSPSKMSVASQQNLNKKEVPKVASFNRMSTMMDKVQYNNEIKVSQQGQSSVLANQDPKELPKRVVADRDWCSDENSKSETSSIQFSERLVANMKRNKIEKASIVAQGERANRMIEENEFMEKEIEGNLHSAAIKDTISQAQEERGDMSFYSTTKEHPKKEREALKKRRIEKLVQITEQDSNLLKEQVSPREESINIQTVKTPNSKNISTIPQAPINTEEEDVDSQEEPTIQQSIQSQKKVLNLNECSKDSSLRKTQSKQSLPSSKRKPSTRKLSIASQNEPVPESYEAVPESRPDSYQATEELIKGYLDPIELNCEVYNEEGNLLGAAEFQLLNRECEECFHKAYRFSRGRILKPLRIFAKVDQSEIIIKAPKQIEERFPIIKQEIIKIDDLDVTIVEFESIENLEKAWIAFIEQPEQRRVKDEFVGEIACIRYVNMPTITRGVIEQVDTRKDRNMMVVTIEEEEFESIDEDRQIVCRFYDQPHKSILETHLKKLQNHISNLVKAASVKSKSSAKKSINQSAKKSLYDVPLEFKKSPKKQPKSSNQLLNGHSTKGPYLDEMQFTIKDSLGKKINVQVTQKQALSNGGSSQASSTKPRLTKKKIGDFEVSSPQKIRVHEGKAPELMTTLSKIRKLENRVINKS